MRPNELEVADRFSIIKIVFAATALGVCGAALVYVAISRARVRMAIPQALRTEQRTDAVKLRLELSSRLFDISLVLMGVIWGLTLTDKFQLRLSLWTHSIMFVAANVLLVFSLLFHLLYKRRISTLMWDLSTDANANLPDIFAPDVDYLFSAQWLFFLASLFVGLLTVLSAKIPGGV